MEAQINLLVKKQIENENQSLSESESLEAEKVFRYFSLPFSCQVGIIENVLCLVFVLGHFDTWSWDN